MAESLWQEVASPWVLLVLGLAYLVQGFFVALVTDNLLEVDRGEGVPAEGLTGINFFWPLLMPDLFFRLWSKRWFGEARRYNGGLRSRGQDLPLDYLDKVLLWSPGADSGKKERDGVRQSGVPGTEREGAG